MKTIEAQAKWGKQKRDILVALLSDEDLKALSKKEDPVMLQGEFHRGIIIAVHESSEEQVKEYLGG